MGVKPDSWIRERAKAGMIEPFVDRQVGEVDGRRVISYGLSSYGYDMRLADEFTLFSNLYSCVVDPKQFDVRAMMPVNASLSVSLDRDSLGRPLPVVTPDLGQAIFIPPNSYALGRSVERFRIPRDVLALCVGKSSYARCGIHVNVTPLEPEWVGHVTIEISNGTPLPVRVYANEGIAQVIFLGADIEFRRDGVLNPHLWRDRCEVSYADRRGKYQNQTGITLPRV